MDIIDSQEFSVNLNNYNGSLNVLLDLAKSQKVNLEDISITLLADQFHSFITKKANINLELAAEYLVMPESDEEEFRVLEVAAKLKLQLKKLELIRLLSDQMLSRKRLGKDVFLRGGKASIRSIYDTKYSLTLFEILKTYSSIMMTRNFKKISIPKLPVFTTEDGIRTIKKYYGKINQWTDIKEFVPSDFKYRKEMTKTGNAGIFSASLELAKEGSISILQKNLFDNIYIKDK